LVQVREMAAHMDRLKLLVVGDSGVGKSSVIHSIVNQEVLYNAACTIGCNAQVMQFTYCGQHGHDRDVFLEFWEIGGSASHQKSRSIFYGGINGLILVHDLSNRKSFLNLRKWLREVLNSGKQELTGVSVGGVKEKIDYNPSSEFSGSLPILILGTKQDQTSGDQNQRNLNSIGLGDNTDVIFADYNSMDESQFASSHSNWNQLEAFFNRVIENRFYPSGRNLMQESEYWRSRRKVF